MIFLCVCHIIHQPCGPPCRPSPYCAGADAAIAAVPSASAACFIPLFIAEAFDKVLELGLLSPGHISDAALEAVAMNFTAAKYKVLLPALEYVAGSGGGGGGVCFGF